MSLDTPDLLLEHLVPESALEFTRTLRSRRHAHRILSTTKNDLGLVDSFGMSKKNG